MRCKPHISIKDVVRRGDYVRWKITYDGIPMVLRYGGVLEATGIPRRTAFRDQIMQTLKRAARWA